jgi:aminoglycoside phosphotransferase (APT) family kinase protein
MAKSLARTRAVSAGDVAIGQSNDRPLDEGIVKRLLSAQFPRLAGAPVRKLAEGWDHELYVVGEDEWVLRFPKRAERVPWLLREIEVVTRVATALGNIVRSFEFVGEASKEFPYPFVGYRFVTGVEADDPAVDKRQLAQEIGQLLRRLHAVDPTGIPQAPQQETPAVTDRIALLTALAPAIMTHLPGRLERRVAPYLVGEVPSPPGSPAGARRLCHHDLCAEHVFVDPANGRITGVIDWTDAVVGDPIGDFVGLITIGGFDFIGEVVAAYISSGGALVPDESLWSALTWWCRTLTLTWLGEALAEDSKDIERHVVWVDRAFVDVALRSYDDPNRRR